MAVDALARAIAAGKTPVTAYDEAVKAGYTGTEEQFAQDMGNSGTNAANAAASASAAAASAESVAASAAQIATNTSDISDLKTHYNGINDAVKTLNGSESDYGFTAINSYTQIGTTGVYAKTENGVMSLYGTASASRWFVCFNNQNLVANTTTNFAQTLPAGVYQFEISTNNEDADHTVWYTESTFNNTYTPRAFDGDIIKANSPVMLGIKLQKDKNFGTNENPTTYTIKIKNYTEKADKSTVNTNSGNIANNTFDINGLNHSIYGYRAITPEWEKGAYKNSDGIKNNDTTTLRTYIRTVNLIDYDENYIISLLNNLPINVRVRLQFYQSDGTFISGMSAFQYSAFRVKDFAPANTGKFAISATSSSHGTETGNIDPTYGDTIYISKNNEALIREVINILNDPKYFNHSFDGANLSLLGDSISAISGYSTSGHNYYPNPNSDVSDVSEMWWKILADSMGMTPLVIGAWSGSCVTSGLRDATSYVPASDPSRCEALHSGTTMPNVILIAMGVNDYSYATSDSFGTWDGTTALGSQSDLSDYDTSTFKTAYATMLARIQHKYPQAFIICITPWFMCRYNTNTGANYLNDIGKSIADYADAVREIANIMHCAVIDGTNIGFNRYNYYPTYAQDSSVKPTHPNINGQKQIADAITRQIKNIHKIN